MKNPVPLLRYVGLTEGASFLLLVGIAMPLKYWAGMPLAVTIVGAIHGGLFVLLSVVLLRTMLVAKWPVSRAAFVWLMALLPFGPFVIDRRVQKYAEEYALRTQLRPLEQEAICE